MKTSRILVAWLLSAVVFGVFVYVAAYEVGVYTHLYLMWLDLTNGDEETTLLLALLTDSLIQFGPGITISFIVFAHVIPNGLVISLRGMLVVVALVGSCLAFAAIDVKPIWSAWPSWLFCAFSALVTVGGLAWLCWQGRRGGNR